jgi:FXSXX-COOH protein
VDTAAAPAGAGESDQPALIDLSGLPIAELAERAGTTLAPALRRLIESLDDPNGIISAFQSFASP